MSDFTLNVNRIIEKIQANQQTLYEAHEDYSNFLEEHSFTIKRHLDKIQVLEDLQEELMKEMSSLF